MTKILKRKIIFKRGISGDGGWGAGMDYLIKKYWDKLDKLVEDNYRGKHNSKLINFLFPEMKKALENSFFEMKRFSSTNKDKKLFENWAKKLSAIKKIGRFAIRPNEKVIFIDAATQFLRESSHKGSGMQRKLKNNSIRKKISEKELRGLPAVKTDLKKIRGKVIIILSPKDFRKFKKGEILVSDETNVAFLPLMKLSKAIITDRGGLLCHAAITARELKKPCIVGAKMATTVLKDGNLVEIEEDSGKIRILKKK